MIVFVSSIVSYALSSSFGSFTFSFVSSVIISSFSFDDLLSIVAYSIYMLWPFFNHHRPSSYLQMMQHIVLQPLRESRTLGEVGSGLVYKD